MLLWDVMIGPTVGVNDDNLDCQQTRMLLFHPTR